MTAEMEQILDCAAPVLPVLTIANSDHAITLAGTLKEGGIHVLEVALRTPDSLHALFKLTVTMEHQIIGAGTVLSEEQAEEAMDAGAEFLVSPGASDGVIAAAAARGVPLLPGAATVTEIMRLAERGFRCVKLFPAEIAGGPALVRAVGSVLPELQLCPTGGIGPDNAAAYLAEPNVPCVGTSWVAPPELVELNSWFEIHRRAQEVVRFDS